MFSPDARQCLLSCARLSIHHTLTTGNRWQPRLADYPPELHVTRACFVTLTRAGQLRGCIGETEASQLLIPGVASHAHAAAFCDPRFPALTAAELDIIQISLSLLTPAESLRFTDETDLLQQLQPGEDGLIIAHGESRATFLPAVWETLPAPAEFLRHLKHKAGWPADRSPQAAWRYRTITISE